MSEEAEEVRMAKTEAVSSSVATTTMHDDDRMRTDSLTLPTSTKKADVDDVDDGSDDSNSDSAGVTPASAIRIEDDLRSEIICPNPHSISIGSNRSFRSSLNSFRKEVGVSAREDTATTSMVGAIACVGSAPTSSATTSSVAVGVEVSSLEEELASFDQTLRQKAATGDTGPGSVTVERFLEECANAGNDVEEGSPTEEALHCAGVVSGRRCCNGGSESSAVLDDQDGEPGGGDPPVCESLVEAELVEPDQTIMVVAKKVIQRKSRKWLIALALATMVVLFIPIAIITAVIVGQKSTDHNQNNMETMTNLFENDAQRLLESIGARIELTMRAADALSFRLVSEARNTDSELPFVTLPDLAVQSAKLLSQTKSLHMAFYPFIPADRRSEWENYTKYNHEWVEEGLDVQSRNPNFQGALLTEYNISDSIWENEGVVNPDNPGPFMPSWMGSPVIPLFPPYNWNALGYEAFAKPLLRALNSKSVIIAPVANHADPNDPVAVAQSQVTNDWASFYLGKGKDTSEPFSDLYYPVVESIDDVVLDVTSDNNTMAVGCLGFSFYWRDVLTDILSANSKGVVVVFENDCGAQTFTYQIDGREPKFLGWDDAHSYQYSKIATSSKLADLLNSDSNGLLYTGLPANGNFCPYTLTAYASDTYFKIRSQAAASAPET